MKTLLTFIASLLLLTPLAFASNSFYFTRKLGKGGGLGEQTVELLCVEKQCRIAETNKEKELRSTKIDLKSAEKIFSSVESSFKLILKKPLSQDDPESILSVSLEHGKFNHSQNIPRKKCEDDCKDFKNEMLSVEHRLLERLRK